MIGTKFLDRYQIQTELGQGGMGVVYRARDQLLKRDVAIKILNESGLGSEGRAKLLHEAQSAASLNHPNIISIYDAGEVDQTAFIIMELIDGSSLYQLKPDNLDDILDITRQVCLALEHAHAHDVIHRDLKPENIIVSKIGVAKLTDFGLARSVASRVSIEGAIIGTVFYLPPEQALGEPVDGRTDLYALGVILYELLTGRLPFQADDPLSVISQHLHAPVVPPSAYNPKLPYMLDDLIVQMLSKRKSERPESAGEVRQVIEWLIHEEEPAAAGEIQPPIGQLAHGRIIGRENEFAEAKTLWREIETRNYDRNVLLISGEAGVGKTPLVREIIALAQLSGARTLTSECYSGDTAPYDPIAQIVRQAIPMLLDKSVIQTTQGGEQQTGLSLLPDFVVSSLLNIAPDLYVQYPAISPNPPLDPSREQQRLFESIYTMCSALVVRSSLLIVLEDIQWADNGTLSMLRYLARRSCVTHLPILFVLTYRDEELDQALSLSEFLLHINRERLVFPIELSRLNRQQTEKYLESMFQDEIDPHFLDAIYQETKGNVFFLEEVCRALIEEGSLYRENGRWHWPEDMSEIEIPQNVRLTVQSRLGRLPEDTQDVLRMAAMIGREFNYHILRSACDMDEDKIIESLELGMRAQLIEEVPRTGGETFVFTHGLTMIILREGISGLRRRRMHSQIANAIENILPNEYAFLAYHHHQAGNDDLALKHYTQAAEHAARVYANRDAIRYYTKAIGLIPEDHLERFNLLSARAKVYDITAEREKQRADVEAMLEIAEMLDDDALRFDAHLALADYYSATEHTKAREPAEEAVELACKIGDPLREGLALRRVGEDARNRKELIRSRQALETSIERFYEAGRPDEAAINLHVLSLTLGDLGEFEQALRAAQEALILSRETGNRLNEATSLRRVAIVHIHLQQYREALQFAEEALELHRQLGDRSEESHALNVIGTIMAWIGTDQQAKFNLEKSIEIAEEIGANQSLLFASENLYFNYYWRTGRLQSGIEFLNEVLEKPMVRENQFLTNSILALKADIYGYLGKYEESLVIAEPLKDISSNTLSASVNAKHLASRGLVLAEMGKFDLAADALLQADELVDRDGTEFEQTMIAIQRGRVALIEKDPIKLRSQLEGLSELIQKIKDSATPHDMSWILTVKADMHLELGENRQALETSSEAVEFLEKSPFVREDVYYTHSKALRANGKSDEAKQALRKAYERVIQIAENLADGEMRSAWMEDSRINRAILEDSRVIWKNN